jgi:hypothetical protein
MIDVNSQAQTAHLIAPNRTQSMSLSKSETTAAKICVADFGLDDSS